MSPGGILITEISEIAPGSVLTPQAFSVDSDGSTERFELSSTDRSGGDIAGWWFDGDKGNKVLIIND